MSLVAGVKVMCREETKVSGTASCWAGYYELSEGMAHTGWALAKPVTVVDRTFMGNSRRQQTRRAEPIGGRFPVRP